MPSSIAQPNAHSHNLHLPANLNKSCLKSQPISRARADEGFLKPEQCSRQCRYKYRRAAGQDMHAVSLGDKTTLKELKQCTPLLNPVIGCANFRRHLVCRQMVASVPLRHHAACNLTSNVMYAVLYSYTPELFPTPQRGTGNALTACCNRIFGIMAVCD